MPLQLPSLVATLGPASWTLARALRRGGATAFRLNASHLDPAQLAGALGPLRRAVPDAEIIVDLQGAKMRLGSLDPRTLSRGERITFALDAADAILLPHPEFFAHARPGDTISVDDDRLHLRVEACETGRLHATALDGGRLLPRKGVNLVQHPVALERLTARDLEAIGISRQYGVGSFAFSFMADGSEAEWVRRAAPGCRVIGKVERREATADLRAIAARVDAVWICRGDLGAQFGPAGLARFVASVSPRDLGVPVLMAGQVLEHLARHPEPTRSEVCHLFDLALRGYAGFVLSDETAVGDDPVNAVRVASSLLRDFQSLNTAG